MRNLGQARRFRIETVEVEKQDDPMWQNPEFVDQGPHPAAGVRRHGHDDPVYVGQAIPGQQVVEPAEDLDPGDVFRRAAQAVVKNADNVELVAFAVAQDQAAGIFRRACCSRWAITWRSMTVRSI